MYDKINISYKPVTLIKELKWRLPGLRAFNNYRS